MARMLFSRECGSIELEHRRRWVKQSNRKEQEGEKKKTGHTCPNARMAMEMSCREAVSGLSIPLKICIRVYTRETTRQVRFREKVSTDHVQSNGKLERKFLRAQQETNPTNTQHNKETRTLNVRWFSSSLRSTLHSSRDTWARKASRAGKAALRT